MPTIVTAVYPELIKSKIKEDGMKNPNFFIGYKFKCVDLCSGIEKEYLQDSMNITYLLYDEKKTMQSMLWQEAEFKDYLSHTINERVSNIEDEAVV